MDFSRDSENQRESRDDDPARIDAESASQDPASPPSIGAYLASQRQLRGISREQLCSQTQIPLRSLVRLESGAFDAIDDGFVRGFVRTVAGALGLDRDDTLARMSSEPTSPKESPREFAGAGLIRIGVLVVALSLVLVSVGLVGVAVQLVPGQNDDSPLILRRDPVRALAEARGVSSFSATQALVPLGPQASPPAISGLEPREPAAAPPGADAPSSEP